MKIFTSLFLSLFVWSFAQGQDCVKESDGLFSEEAVGVPISNGLPGTEIDSVAYCLGLDLGEYVKNLDTLGVLSTARIIDGIKDIRDGKPSIAKEDALALLKGHFGEGRRAEPGTVAYCVGLDIGEYVKSLNLPLNIDVIGAAINDTRAGRPALTTEVSNSFLREFFLLRKPAMAKRQEVEFLASVEQSGKVRKTPSGLLYQIITPGSNIKPVSDEDVVRVDYEGFLKNGEIFDSSIERGDAPQFKLSQVIKGWSEGLKLIGKGGKIKLYIPSELAYGEQGASGKIGPNEPVVFVIELIDVNPPQ